MKTYRNHLWLLAATALAAFTFTACTNDAELQHIQTESGSTLLASIGTGGDTRTSVADNNKTVNWSANDQFGVVFTKESSTDLLGNYMLISGQGTTNGEFELQSNPSTTDYTEGTYAVYPYQQKMSLNAAGALTMHLNGDGTMEYTQDSNGPMWGTVESGKVTFKHLAGLLKVTLNKMPADAAKFVLTASNPVAGQFTATLTDQNPQLVAASENTYTTVTITLGTQAVQAESEVSQSFYIPIPAGTYSTLKIALKTEDDSDLYFKQWNGVNVTVGHLLYATLDVLTVTGDTPAAITEAIKDIVATDGTKESNVAITGQLTTSDASGENATISIPVAQGAVTNLTFEKAPTTTANVPLVFAESENSTNVQSNLSLAIPEPTEQAKAPSVTLNMPNTTVTLAPVGATATFNKVVAKTAANTLIIKEGVTVEELVIEGGNVEVRGTVKKLSRADTNTDATTIVTSYGKGDIKDATNADDKITFRSVWDGVSTVTPEEHSGVYDIYTAAQLASFQVKQSPTSGNANNLAATVDKNMHIHAAEIDLNNHPWAGMILAQNIVLTGAAWQTDGTALSATEVPQSVIKNVRITKHVLNETSQYTPEACVGFIAIAKQSVQIKNIAIEGFKTEAAGADAKWSGALVGYSYGAILYENCRAKDVDIQSDAYFAYRIGGLIGFIANDGTNAKVEVKNCHAENVTIKGAFSLGGLVGTIQDANACDFANCTTSKVQLSLCPMSAAFIGGNSSTTFSSGYGWAGVLSLFIGDVNSASCDLTLTDCEAKDSAFTEAQIAAFGMSNILNYTYNLSDTEEQKAQAKENAEKFNLAFSTSNLIPAKVLAAKSITIVTNGTSTSLVDKIDYNLYTEITNDKENAPAE